MAEANKESNGGNLPPAVTEFIEQVIKKMRYRKKVRLDVRAELEGHFADELKGCEGEQQRRQKADELVGGFGDVKLLAVLLRRAKKRCRPVWQKVLVRSLHVLGILVLYSLLCASPLILGRPTIGINYVDWVNERVKAGRDEAENARPYYEKACELYVMMPDWLAESRVKWPGDLNDVELAGLSDWLGDNEGALEALREGSRRPYFWRQYRSSGGELSEGLVANAMEILPEYRRLAFAMSWQIQYEAYKGDVGGSLRDFVVLVKVGDHLDGKGLLIEQMVGVAIESLAYDALKVVLQRANVQADVLKTVQDELGSRFQRSGPIISLDAEKAFWYDQIQRTFTDDGKGGGRVLMRGLPYVVDDWRGGLWSLFTFSCPGRREAVDRVDNYFARAFELLSKTPWELDQAGIDRDRWSESLQQGFMLKVLGPAHYRISELSWRLATHRAAVLTMLALMRYEKDKGQYPADLSGLIDAGYVRELEGDPYSGGSLVYKRLDEGFVLYGLGTDLKDDGGKPGVGKEGKRRKWSDDGDWVFWPVPGSGDA